MMAGGFERLGDTGQLFGNLAGGAGGDARGVEAVRRVPDGLEPRQHGFIGQFSEPDAVRTCS